MEPWKQSQAPNTKTRTDKYHDIRQVPSDTSSSSTVARIETDKSEDVKYLYKPCTTTVAEGHRVNNNHRCGSDKTSEIDFMDRQVPQRQVYNDCR